MHILSWIDKNINDVKRDRLFVKYFGSTSIEKGVEDYFLFNQEAGIDLTFEENCVVKSIHFYGRSKSGIKPFNGFLPLDLEFSFSREKSRTILGKPNFVGGGDFSFLYGLTPAWDKYLFKDFSLHLQFSKGENEIDLVTV
jgi:hypothetical protein